MTAKQVAVFVVVLALSATAGFDLALLLGGHLGEDTAQIESSEGGLMMDDMTTADMVLSTAEALGRACLEMEKADRNKSPDVGEKTDEVIRLRNRLTQVARNWATGGCTR